jgi:hypothetical protein
VSVSEEQENFLRDYVELCSGTEIPRLFSIWCGLSGISAMLGRRCWIDMGTYTIYPNLFIVLVAGSGRCRKSTAIGVMERLLRASEPKPNIIAQRITPEGLIDAVRVLAPSTDGKAVGREVSEGFILVDELSTFLNRHTYEAGLASLLIPLYDCKDSFEYRTKGRGAENIIDSCLGLLGASTIDWLRSAIPEDAIGGGLTSRIVFVYVEAPPPPVAITTFSDRKKHLAEKLVRTLQRVAMCHGPVTLSPDAWQYYVEEYEGFYKTSSFFEDHTLSGYASRRHVHLLKIAMSFAASSATGTTITIFPHDLEAAKALLVQSESLMPRVLSLITTNERGAVVEVVYRRILGSPKSTLKFSDLMRSLSHKIDSRELSMIIQTLVQAKKIRIGMIGSETAYQAIV